MQPIMERRDDVREIPLPPESSLRLFRKLNKE